MSDAPEGCVAWHNPEFRDTKKVTLGPSRIHSGLNSQKYFTFWSVHQAGVMQTVAVPAGARCALAHGCTRGRPIKTGARNSPILICRPGRAACT